MARRGSIRIAAGAAIRAGAIAAALVAADCNVMRRPARVGPMQEQQFTVDRDGATDAALRVSYWGGQLRVRPGDAPYAARLHTRDNIDTITPHADARRDGERLDVRLWLDSENTLVNLKSWNRDEREQDPTRDLVNEWDLELADGLPIALDLDLAACDADLELGGLKLRAARLDLGGGTARLSFGKPDPLRIERLELDVGAGRLEARHLGNAHARTIAVDVGAGSCLLDLSGDWREDALVRVDAGASGIEIRVPRDLAVKADLKETTLASFAAPDFQSDGEKCFTSPAWGRGGPSIVIEVDASLGSVRLVRE